MKTLFFAIFFWINVIAKAQDCYLHSVHFDNKQVKIKQEFYPDIFYVVQFLKENPEKKLMLTGYDTKDVDIAIRRAEKVQEFMIETFHFTCNRFETSAKVIETKYTKNPKTPPIDYINSRVDFECMNP